MRDTVEPLSTPYSALANKPIEEYVKNSTSEIKKRILIEASSATGLIKKIDDGILALVGEWEDMDVFLHPVKLDNDTVFLDLRGLFNREGKIRNMAQYNFMLNRAKMDLRWYSKWDTFIDFVKYPAKLYANWITYALVSRLNLDNRMGLRVKVLSLIYFLGKVQRETVPLESDRAVDLKAVELARQVMSIDKILSSSYSDLLDQYGASEVISLNTPYVYKGDSKINELARFIEKDLQSKAPFTYDVLSNIVAPGSYISTNSRNDAATALEHVPLFYLMAYDVTMNGSMSKTKLGSIAKNSRKAEGFSNFAKFVTHVINN